MKDFLNLIWGQWSWTARLYGLAVIGAILLIFFVVSGVKSCQSEKAKQAGEKNKSEIEKDKGKIELLEEKEKEVIENEKQVNENVRQSENNFNSVIRRDSGTFNGNFNSAKRKFCQQFPDDSKCR